MSKQMLKMTSFNCQRCLTSGWQVIEKSLKSLPRNFEYYPPHDFFKFVLFVYESLLQALSSNLPYRKSSHNFRLGERADHKAWLIILSLRILRKTVIALLSVRTVALSCWKIQYSMYSSLKFKKWFANLSDILPWIYIWIEGYSEYVFCTNSTPHFNLNVTWYTSCVSLGLPVGSV